TLYLEEKAADEVQSLLYEMRSKAGLNISQVAERMGVSQPAVSKLERNADKATLSSLLRYAKACGMELKLSARY
ncbi:MAG: helix-turn-helix transcriptional regulator, partial [Mannheimia varigena]|nr:helix-turn-helix transcriptional regulator [Mannheimia varigena]